MIPIFDLLWIFLLGLMIGSFLNVIIYRLPLMLAQADASEQNLPPRLQQVACPPVLQQGIARYNLCTPRSSCPHCGHFLHWWENIPLFSYLWLRGRCSACHALISRQYFLGELTTAVLALISVMKFGYTLTALAILVFCAFLLMLACIDLHTFWLPDILTQPLLWLGLLFNSHGGLSNLADAVLGAVTGYLLLWSLYWVFRLCFRKEGMGYGDFKLLAAIGAWLGWQALPEVLLLASISGIVIGGGWLILHKKSRETPIPFGPYLAIGALVSVFGGKQWLLVAG